MEAYKPALPSVRQTATRPNRHHGTSPRSNPHQCPHRNALRKQRLPGLVTTLDVSDVHVRHLIPVVSLRCIHKSVHRGQPVLQRFASRPRPVRPTSFCGNTSKGNRSSRHTRGDLARVELELNNRPRTYYSGQLRARDEPKRTHPRPFRGTPA